MKKINTLKKKLDRGEYIVLDGAMGTELQRYGVSTTLPLWSADALITDPEVVERIHLENIQAGADIITTNTFRTTQRTLKKVGKSDSAIKLTHKACLLAQRAIAKSKVKKNVYVAGSVAPLEDCYSPELTPKQMELESEHIQYAQDLKTGGVDFILLETMITIRETKAALDAAKNVKLPVAVSFCCDRKFRLLGGEPMSDAIKLAEEYDPLFISINCISPETASFVVKKLRKSTTLPIGIYANGFGSPDSTAGWRFSGLADIDMYRSHADIWVNSGVQIIGACCGATIDYMHAIVNFINSRRT